ncbi:hypothetical protein [Roseovarius aquimarinus]|uniref:Uncharacterized protein n=1 Tax=Roseovarius aquimarinus TaxID=1229156 RepID=A0ABW7I9R4_9RHOB
MQLQPAAAPSPARPDLAASRPERAELVQRWCDGCGLEGSSLEWMLDRTRTPREART